MVQANSNPHRIALITGGLPLGGSTTFLCNLGAELVRRGIPAEVLSFESENPLAADFERLRVPVRSQQTALILEDRMENILHQLRDFRPTVVVANLSATSFEVLRYLPPGVFRVGVAHADHPLVYKMLRHYAPFLDLMGVVSENIERTLRTMPEFKDVPVHYLPLGVPMPAETAEHEVNGPLRILYLGRLSREQKRVHLFPEILDHLKRSGIPFHWTIAGEGPEAGALRQSMSAGRPDQTVSFPGSIPYSEVPRVLLDHDIFLLTSDYEGLPLGLLEAMGSGLVPVVTDLPSGIPELVTETTGKRVPASQVAGYAEAIVWLHQHRQEIPYFSRNARQKVEGQFSVAAMTDRWLNVFSSPSGGIAWPDHWHIHAPLVGGGGLRFSKLGRAIRRRLRARRKR